MLITLNVTLYLYHFLKKYSKFILFFVLTLYTVKPVVTLQLTGAGSPTLGGAASTIIL